jgi:hypothetical protein
LADPRRLSSLILWLGVVLTLGPGQARAVEACPVIDVFGDFVALSQRTAGKPPDQQQAEFRSTFLRAHGDLYTHEAIGLSPGPKLDARALDELETLRTDPALLRQREALAGALSDVTARFGRAFPDFRCDFPIYLAPTFGAMDGAGRIVGGYPAMVLGVDTIARLEQAPQIPVFLTHELFHRYHLQAAGFSDDLAERDVIWRSLWAEGLATYVSAQLNPDRPLSDALLLPKDLEARAKPLVPVLAREMLSSLDRTDPKLFAAFFLYQDPAAAQAGWPSRSGYYLGYLVARRLAEHHTLPELAHLSGPQLRQEIGEALKALE